MYIYNILRLNLTRNGNPLQHATPPERIRPCVGVPLLGPYIPRSMTLPQLHCGALSQLQICRLHPLPLRNGHIYMNDVQYAETNQKKFPIYNF